MITVGGAGVRRVGPLGNSEAMLAMTGNKEGLDCECLSANSRLINFSHNSSKRIGVSQPWTISTMDL